MLLEEERSGARDKEVFLNSAKSALKDKEEEISRIWAMAEELKSESSGLKAILKAKEAEIAAAEKRFLAAAAENKPLVSAVKELQGRLDAAAAAIQEEKAGAQSLEKQKKEILDTLNVTRAQCRARAAETQSWAQLSLSWKRGWTTLPGAGRGESGGGRLKNKARDPGCPDARPEAAGRAKRRAEASLVELRSALTCFKTA